MSPSKITIALGLCLLLLSSTCRRRESRPPLKIDPVWAPTGLGGRAFQHVAELVSFGERHTGSKGSLRGLKYLEEQLVAIGLKPVRDEWEDKIEKIKFINMSVTLKGRSPHKIVIGCHHDTKNCHTDSHDFYFVGANDSASGVAMLIELARVLSAKKDRLATYEFVWFDGEESLTWKWTLNRALFGSRHYVRRYEQSRIDNPEAPEILAFVLIDMVGATDLHIDDETNSDQEFRDIFYAAAKAVGHADYFYKYSLAITDDHIPFLNAQKKIRSIDLIDLENNPQWHTKDDTLKYISADSLHLVGEVVLTALPALEQLLFPPPSKKN